MPLLAVPRLILLPIGISFFTFQALSYVIDVYRRDARRHSGTRSTSALYIALLPAADRRADRPLPRRRARSSRERRSTRDGFARGVRRFVVGLGEEGADRQHRGRCRPTRSSRCRRSQLDGRARLARRRLLHAADLLRLLGLLRHGHRPRRACSGSASPRTSTTPTSRARSPSSGGAGTSRCRPGSATTSTSRSAATAWRRARLPQPGDRVLPVRPLARRELDLRGLGPVPRRVPRARARRLGGLARALAAAAAPRLRARSW